MNLPEIIEANEAYSPESAAVPLTPPFPLVLPPVVSRKPFSSEDLADKGVKLPGYLRIFWVKDPKGAWGLLAAQQLMSYICLNI